MLNTCNFIKDILLHRYFTVYSANILFFKRDVRATNSVLHKNFSLQNPQPPYNKHETCGAGDDGLPPFPALKKCYQLGHKLSKTFTALKYPRQM